jgi:hypothetical protein
MKFVIRIVFTIFLCLSFSFLHAQSLSIKGRLTNIHDNSPINGGVIILNPGSKLCFTDQTGTFKFKSTAGKKNLSTRVLGYKNVKTQFTTYSDTTINIILEIDPFQIKEVTIIGDSAKNIERSEHGNIILTRASLIETPRYFSEPDLIKSLQNIPGVISGKDGTTDIFVRGGSPGQNIYLANGCYFFLPSHLMGLTSSFDLDFIDKTELIKDYFPPDIDGGAASVIKIDYRIPQSDSASMKLRLGLLTSGMTFQIPINKLGLGITGGIKRGNYSVYAPLLKTLLDKNIGDYLPPNDYTFYDSYLRLTKKTAAFGDFSYLFSRNRDNGSTSNNIESKSGDTLLTSETGLISSWTNVLHSLEWTLPINEKNKILYDLNYNEISVQNENYIRSNKNLDNALTDSKYNSYRFSPKVINVGSKIQFIHFMKNYGYSSGISFRYRDFNPNITAINLRENKNREVAFVDKYKISEPAAFISANLNLFSSLMIQGGLRISEGLIDKTKYVNLEPRLRLTYNSSKSFSQHVNYVKLTQYDHSIESSNPGLRSLLWIPITNKLGPEVSKVWSAGINGNFKTYAWSIDLYFKTLEGIADFKPGASFFYSTSIDDMIDVISGRAYGIEAFLVKRIGKLTGNFTYNYSRSKRQWYAPEGTIWIPSAADRPHNINIALKYYWKTKTSLGLNWVYSSGLPATIYIHTASYWKWFETKNNFRFPDYHRLDLSLRRIFKVRFGIFNLDFDLSNIYNRKNTFYLKETFDEKRKTFIYKNIALFPIMPSISFSFQHNWKMK